MKPWPWPQADEGLYRATRAMLAATEGLSITGWETACKFSPARLLSVSEDASPRASWAAKFYDSSLRIADLRLGVSGLAAAWGLDADQVDVVFDAIGGRELGWLAAGTGSDARPFFTVYAAADRRDAHQALFAFAEAQRAALPHASGILGASV